MSSPRDIQNSQSWIIDPALRMGFISDIDGICYALAHIAKKFLREGRIDEFDNCLKVIEQLGKVKLQTDNSITDDKRYVLNQVALDFQSKRFKVSFGDRNKHIDQIVIKDLKSKTGSGIQNIVLTPPLINIKNNKELKKLLNEIVAFYNEVEIYFHPHKYQHLFAKEKKPYHQNYQFAEELFRTDKSTEHTIVVNNKTGRFDQDENNNPADLLEYVQRFVEIIHASKGQFEIDVILESGNHAITLGYHPKTKELVIANANPPPLLRLPLNQDFKLEPGNELIAAKFLENSFFQRQTANTPIFFGTLMSVPKAAEQALEPLIKNWKADFKKTQISRKKVKFSSADDKDTTGVNGLYVASRNNDSEMVEILLRYRADPNADYRGYTPLYVAAARGHLETVNCLLELSEKLSKKIDIEKGVVANNINHYSPLYGAACEGRLEVIKILVKHKAKIDEPTVGDAKTPIYSAAERGFTDVVAFLLDQGVPINKTCQGKSLLFVAAENGHEELVKLLLNRGANLGDLFEGQYPLHIAAKNGHVKVVEEILQHTTAFIDKREQKFLVTALELAISYNHEQVAACLLKNHAKMLNAERGELYLKQASSKGNHKMVALLLQNGVEFKTKSTKTDLQEAVREDLIEAIRQEKIADVFTVLTVFGKVNVNDAIDDKQHTLLGLAVKEQKIQSIKFLCEHTSAKRDINYDGKPLLWHAVEANNPALIKCLIRYRATIVETLHLLFNEGKFDKIKLLCSYGVKIDAPYQGESLLRKAAIKNDQAGIDFLMATGANYFKVYSQAMLENNNEIITALLKNDKVKVGIENRYTLIEFAIENKLTKHALDLIKKNTDLNKVCADGKLLLFKAVAARDDAVITLLLEQIRIFSPDSAAKLIGKTLIDLIKADDQQGLQLLLKQKVDLNAEYAGRTALYQAAKLKNDNLIKMLVQNGASVELALSFAIKEGNQDVIERLLPLHGSVDKPIAKNNLSMIALAVDRNQFLLVDFFMQKNANLKGIYFEDKPLLFHLCNMGSLFYHNHEKRKKVSAYINLVIKADPDSIAETLCLLAYPTYSLCAVEGMQQLLDAGVSLDQVNKRTNETTLYVAAKTDNYEVVDFLLQNDVDTTIRCHGKTSLEVAPKHSAVEDMLTAHKEKIESLHEVQALIHNFYNTKGKGMAKLEELVGRLSENLLKDYKNTNGQIDYKKFSNDMIFQKNEFGKTANVLYFNASRIPMLCKQYYYIQKLDHVFQQKLTVIKRHEVIKGIYESDDKLSEILEFNPKRLLVQAVRKVTKTLGPSSSSSSSTYNNNQSSTLFQPSSSTASTTTSANIPHDPHNTTTSLGKKPGNKQD